MERNTKKQFRGIVVSDKMDKTIVVKVDRSKKHPLYHKRFTASSKFKVHDEKNIAKIGDLVKFAECKPISKDKTFRLVEIKEAK